MRDAGTTTTYGSGDSTTAALSPASSVTSRLRATLAEVLDEFEREQRQAGDGPGLQTYQVCCSRLVTYMATRMETSPRFALQMQQVILASFSDAELPSLGLGDLWARYPTGSSAGSWNADNRNVGTGVPSTPLPQETTIKEDTANDGAVTVTPLAIARALAGASRPTCSPHVDLTISTLTVGKRQTRRDGVVSRHVAKRARHTVARNLYGDGGLDCEEKGEESVPEGAKDSATETESEEEVSGDAEAVDSMTATSSVNAESDDVAWPCAGDDPSDRSPAFLQRVKMAIELVDAENCCPPPGEVCTQGCVRIRGQMCETHRAQGGNAMPCHNGTCCVWCGIDTHSVRCANSQCEFKNRVGLRQTMYSIQQKELKLKATHDQLMVAKERLHGVDGDAKDKLEGKAKRLEYKCEKLEDAVGLHTERKYMFLSDLDAIGLRPVGDEMDGLPSFNSHYARKETTA
jgi:hypothetical protein